MGLKANADGSGAIQVGGSDAITITSGLVVSMNGGVGGLVSGTAVASTSGTSIDFTLIPSWVKRITVMFSEVSLAAAGTVRIRVGTSSGLVTTGYTGGIVTNTLAPAITMTNLNASPEGMAGFSTTAATATITTQYIISNLSGNIWVCTGMAYRFGDGIFQNSAGGITLSGTLDRVSVVATTSSFDAGSINILYE
jgi:hypothetical protein